MSPDLSYALGIAGLAVVLAIAAAGYAYDARRQSQAAVAQMALDVEALTARLEAFEEAWPWSRESEAEAYHAHFLPAERKEEPHV